MNPIQRPTPGKKLKQGSYSDSMGDLQKLTNRHLKSTELLSRQLGELQAPPMLNLGFAKAGEAVNVVSASPAIAPMYEQDLIELHIVRPLDAFRARVSSFVEQLTARVLAIVGMKRGMHAGSVEAISQLRSLSRVYISECRSQEELAVLERMIAESYFELLFAAQAHKDGKLAENKAYDSYQGAVNKFITRWKKKR